MSDSLWPHGLYTAWNSPGLSLLQGIFPTQGLNPGLQHCRRILYQLSYQEGRTKSIFMGLGVCFEYSPHYDNRRELMSIVVLVQSLSCVWLFATPQRIACQDPWSMGFPRQECWHGLPFPPPGEPSWPGDWTWVCCIGKQILYHWATRKAQDKRDVSDFQTSLVKNLKMSYDLETSSLPLLLMRN